MRIDFDESTFLIMMDLFDGMLDEKGVNAAMNTMCMAAACACLNAGIKPKDFSKILPSFHEAAKTKYDEVKGDTTH